METTSVSLLERLRQPEAHKAWDRFIALYSPLLYQWARRLGLQAADAADLVQQVFVVLVRRLPEFHYEPGKHFRGWLWTVLVHQCRKEQKRAARVRPTADLEVADRAAPADDLEEAAYRRHLVGRALTLIEGDFQPSTWRVCQEYLIAGRPAAEVAAELGLSVAAVYAAKSRVLRHLRRELEGLLE